MTIIQVITIVVSLLLIFGWCEYTRVDELARARAIVKKLNRVRNIIRSMDTIFNIDKRNSKIILKKLRTIRSILIELDADINPLTDNKELVDILITERLVMVDELINIVTTLIRVQRNYSISGDDVKHLYQHRMSVLNQTIIDGLDILVFSNMAMHIIYDFTSDYKQNKRERVNDVLQ